MEVMSSRSLPRGVGSCDAHGSQPGASADRGVGRLADCDDDLISLAVLLALGVLVIAVQLLAHG